jgi:ABC-type sugar transport system ATPase subunit
MREGVIEQAGLPEELCSHPATGFVASFVGDPPISILRARLEREADALSLLAGENRLLPANALGVCSNVFTS